VLLFSQTSARAVILGVWAGNSASYRRCGAVPASIPASSRPAAWCAADDYAVLVDNDCLPPTEFLDGRSDPVYRARRSCGFSYGIDSIDIASTSRLPSVLEW
jgi:hypothetical protein